MHGGDIKGRGVIFLTPGSRFYSMAMDRFDDALVAADARAVIPTMSVEACRTAYNIFQWYVPLGTEPAPTGRRRSTAFHILEYDPANVRALALVTVLGRRSALVIRREVLGHGWGMHLQVVWGVDPPRRSAKRRRDRVLLGLVDFDHVASPRVRVLDVLLGGERMPEPLQRVHALYSPAPAPRELVVDSYRDLRASFLCLPLVLIATRELPPHIPPVVFVDDPRDMYGGSLPVAAAPGGELVPVPPTSPPAAGARLAHCTFDPTVGRWSPVKGASPWTWRSGEFPAAVEQQARGGGLLSPPEVDEIQDMSFMVHRHFESAVLTLVQRVDPPRSEDGDE